MRYDTRRQAVWLGLAGVALTACGGEVSRSGGGDFYDPRCTTGAETFASAAAVTSALCSGALPADAPLAAIAHRTSMDNRGLSPYWRLTYIDMGGVPWKVEVSITGSTVLALQGFESPWSCTRGVNDATSSDIVVPDAMERLRSHGVDADRATMATFSATGHCDPPAVYQGISVSARCPSADLTESEWWGLYYEADGQFVRMCGPCAVGAEAPCAPCTPD